VIIKAIVAEIGKRVEYIVSKSETTSNTFPYLHHVDHAQLHPRSFREINHLIEYLHKILFYTGRNAELRMYGTLKEAQRGITNIAKQLRARIFAPVMFP
jgi:hypothetical protein